MNLVRTTSVAASRTSGIHIWRRDPRAPKNSSEAASGVKCHAWGRKFRGSGKRQKTDGNSQENK